MPANQAKTVSTLVPANFVLTTHANTDVLKPILLRPMGLSLLPSAVMLASQVLIAQVQELANSVSMVLANTDAQTMKFSLQSKQHNAVMHVMSQQIVQTLEHADSALMEPANTDALSLMESQSSFPKFSEMLNAVTHAMSQPIVLMLEHADSALKEPANTDAD